MKTSILLFMNTILLASAWAQNNGGNVISELWGKSNSYVENIIPPSPNAAHASRYADYPITYCLGLVNITIPIYTIRSRELSLPIELSYHSGGIKVDEVAGVAGLGWTLNAGGVIAREIAYMPDEYQSEYGEIGDFFKMMTSYYIKDRLKDNLEDPIILEYFRSVWQHRNDSNYDKYNYNFCGHSGSFIIPREQPSDKIRHIVVNNYQIIPSEDLHSFIIITDDGTQYYFSEQEQVSKRQVEIQSGVSDYYAPDAWYLTSIVSFNKTDTIRLEYATIPTWEKTVSTTTMTMSGSVDASNYVALSPPVASTHSIEYKYKPKVLTHIYFSGGNVTFNYDDENEKINHQTNNLRDEVYNFPKKLHDITIKNSLGDIIKKSDFTISRFSNDKRICLSALKIYSGSVLDETYDFTYNNPTSSINRFSQDFFGYFNGVNNSSLNPIQSYDDFFSDTFPGKCYSFNHAKTFSLAQINRNGVRTILEYEPNAYTYADLKNINIGVRIKSISTYNGNLLIRKKSLSYDEAQCTIDFSVVDKSFYLSRSYDSYMANNYEHFTVSISIMEHSVAPGAAPENAKICYGKVTEIINDGTSGNRVKTEYLFDCEPDINKYVATGGILDTCILNEKFSQTSYISNDGNSSGYAGEIRGYFKEKPQFFNNLIEKNVYRTNATGQYTLVSQINNTYKRDISSDVLTDFYIRHLGEGGSDGEAGIHPGGGDEIIDGGDIGIITPIIPADPTQNAMNAKNFYFFHVYAEAAHGSRIYDSQQIDYDYYGAMIKKHNRYHYSRSINYNVWPAADIAIGPMDESESIIIDPIDVNSDEALFQSSQQHRHRIYTDSILYDYNYLYPETYSTLAPYDRMIDKNNLTTVVGEELIKLGSTYSLRPYNIYRKGRYIGYDTFIIDGDSLILPHQIIEKVNNTTVWQQEILRYDKKGNIAEIQENTLPRVCYLWGYNHMYPVAEIRNANYEDVVRVMGGENIIQGIAYSTQLDNDQYALLLSLRQRLPEASITIFRYIPLVGISDVVDPSGRMTHYKYDNAWRLSLVCDDAGEPVESYEYFKNMNIL